MIWPGSAQAPRAPTPPFARLSAGLAAATPRLVAAIGALRGAVVAHCVDPNVNVVEARLHVSRRKARQKRPAGSVGGLQGRR